MSNEALIALSVTAGFPFAFLVIGSSVLALLSGLSGWRALGERFEARGPRPAGAVLTSGRVGWVSYNNCLWIAAQPEGLWMSPLMIVRPFHPPLLIPWSAVEKLGEQRSWGFRYDAFNVAGVALKLRAGKLGLPAPR